MSFHIACFISAVLALANIAMFVHFYRCKDGMGRVILMVFLGFASLYFALRTATYMTYVFGFAGEDFKNFMLRYSAYLIGAPTFIAMAITRPWERD